MKTAPEENKSDKDYRGDELILRKLLQKKIIAIIVVIGIIFFAFAQFLDYAVRTKENWSILFSDDPTISSVDTITEEPSPVESSPSDQILLEEVSKPISIIEEPVNPIQDQNKNIKDLKLSDKVVDENGLGIEGVEVWCKNCLSKEKVMTGPNGKFQLARQFELIDEINHALVICFLYNNQELCSSPQFKYINQFKTPKFLRK